MTRDHVVSVRFSDDERLALADIAEATGIPLSELVRRSALALTYPPPPAVGGTSAAPLVRTLIGGRQ